LGGTDVNLALGRDGGRSRLTAMPTRPLVRAAAALAAVVLCLALPVGAGAQSAPSLGAPSEEESAPVVAETTGAEDDGLDTWQQVLIFAAGVVLLGGIAWAIIGDARHRAPVTPRGRASAAAAGGGRLPPHERRRRKERARARARAQRQARRRNR
jgi:hypothetical protein